MPVSRTVCLIEPEDDPRFGQEGLTLADFRKDRCYVLLGDPGMGKSTAFEIEALQFYDTEPITARRFIRGDMERSINLTKGPIFIDGLDEVRAGGKDPRTPLDKILGKLTDLRYPRFRISCRSNGWLESGDLKELAFHSGRKSIPVLQLDSLSRRNVEEIITDQRIDATAFIEQTVEHGLGAFLENPQLLDILLKSVDIHGWPQSPTEAFEQACRVLATERNTEYKDAQRGVAKPSQDDILNEAGKLFALMLISGKIGCTETEHDDNSVLYLGTVLGNDRMALKEALNSGLFKGRPKLRGPAHRQYAEFLGARFLDDRISDKGSVTAKRVLSVLLGHDGMPLPDLQGLSSWLASFNSQARKSLISADPISIALYGDASGFNDEERSELLENLEEYIEFTQIAPTRLSLRALVGHQGMSAIKELTSDSVRSTARQRLLHLVLSGFSAGKRIARAERESQRHVLLGIVQDDTWWGDVRCEAIDALNRLLQGSVNHSAALNRLIDDIQGGCLPDEKNNLLGTCLSLLYPRDLSPDEVWRFLDVTPYPRQINAYSQFWAELVEKSRDEDVSKLLDTLCARASAIIPKLADHGLEYIVLELLAKGLEVYGDKQPTREIYRWFELVETELQISQLVPANLRDRLYLGANAEAEDRIRKWLNERQVLQYELIEYGLGKRESIIGQERLDIAIGRKFLGSEAPSGFRSWCIGRAVTLWDTMPKVAEELARWAVLNHQNWGPVLTDEEVAETAQDSPAMRDWNKRRLADKRDSQSKQEVWKKRAAESAQKHKEKLQAELSAIRQQVTELANGRCIPRLLHSLSQNYMDGLAKGHPSEGPIEELKMRLDNDQSLVDATLSGLRSLLNRDDLPSLDEIATQYGKNRLSLFALPFLAGMAEEERMANDPLEHLDEQGRLRALAFYYVERLPEWQYSGPIEATIDSKAEHRPAWYLRALSVCPESVADALVAMHNAQVRRKASPCEYLFAMSQDPVYEQAAVLAVRRMFTVFPTRCTIPQVDSLRAVLWAAIVTKGIPAAGFRDLVLRRLRRRGIDTAQRAHWLCAGLYVARKECLPQLEEFLSEGSEIRALHVFKFFRSNHPRLYNALPLNTWTLGELSRLIRILATQTKRFSPLDSSEVLGYEFELFDGMILVDVLIRSFSNRIEDEAGSVIESLIDDSDLGRWQRELAMAKEAYVRNRRLAKQKVLSVEDIQTTLNGGPPAHAADLSALVLDCLERLAERIRKDSTSDWRQYWHLDKRRPKEPKYEVPDCRDQLLSDLKLMLKPHALDAQAEGKYSDSKSADIRVSAGPDLAIPIEIKRSMNDKLWSAVEKQLVPKYTRAPESDGHGIYVVLWFGSEYIKSPGRGAFAPRTPAELKQQLLERLPADLQTKISIVVIDVSLSGRDAKRLSASTKT